MRRFTPPKIGDTGSYKRFIVRWRNGATLSREEWFTDYETAENFYNILVMNDYDTELICEEVKSNIIKIYFLNLLKKEDNEK